MRTVNPVRVENRKRQILEAARYCFEQKGFHAASMAEICARAEISPGALYRYFSSKEEIITAMCEETSFNAIDSIRNKVANVDNGGDFNANFSDLIHEVVDLHFSKEQGAMAAESLAEAMRNKAFAEAANAAFSEYQIELVQLINLGQRDGFVDKDLNSDEAAIMLMALLDGLMLRSAFTDDVDKIVIEKMIINLATRYFCGDGANSSECKFNLDTYFETSRKGGVK